MLVSQKLSREWRKARRDKEPEKIQRVCRERYFEQKKITAIMTARKKNWEKRKIEETKNDGKFWGMIKDLLGKNREREEDTYVYTQDGVRKEIMEISEKYVDKWKKNSFQKNERTDFSFWY